MEKLNVTFAKAYYFSFQKLNHIKSIKSYDSIDREHGKISSFRRFWHKKCWRQQNEGWNIKKPLIYKNYLFLRVLFKWGKISMLLIFKEHTFTFKELSFILNENAFIFKELSLIFKDLSFILFKGYSFIFKGHLIFALFYLGTRRKCNYIWEVIIIQSFETS